MAGFTKLFSSILTSSIWTQPDSTLRVWIALLALVEHDGVVEGSVPGIASLCRLPVEATEEILKRLSEPDKYSRSPENEGRRIRPIEGGWVVLNYLKYREKPQGTSGSRAPYMRAYRSAYGGSWPTPKRRAFLLARDGSKCRSCGSTSELEIDHIIERADGGSDEDSNLQVLCAQCNLRKRDVTAAARRVAQRNTSVTQKREERRERTETTDSSLRSDQASQQAVVVPDQGAVTSASRSAIAGSVPGGEPCRTNVAIARSESASASTGRAPVSAAETAAPAGSAGTMARTGTLTDMQVRRVRVVDGNGRDVDPFMPSEWYTTPEALRAAQKRVRELAHEIGELRLKRGIVDGESDPARILLTASAYLDGEGRTRESLAVERWGHERLKRTLLDIEDTAKDERRKAADRTVVVASDQSAAERQKRLLEAYARGGVGAVAEEVG